MHRSKKGEGRVVGLWWKHDANGICAIAGCGTNIQARGLCGKHGAKAICSVAGCGTNAVAQGLCTEQGGKSICSAAGCATNAVARNICRKHGVKGIYSVAGCGTNAAARGLCGKHGAKGTRLYPARRTRRISFGRILRPSGVLIVGERRPMSHIGITSGRLGCSLEKMRSAK